MGSFPTWNILKHTCMTPEKLVMHGWNSMPHVGIQLVSLKAYRRWASMCHRMMTVSQIDEPLDLLDSRHKYSAKGGPLLCLHGQGILF